jgi:hypothetical protein
MKAGLAVLACLSLCLFIGCGGDGGDEDAGAAPGEEVLTGVWEANQLTIGGSTVATSGLQTSGTLTLNEDGTFVLQTTGLIALQYTGTFSATNGQFTMAVNETGRTVTGAYELSPGLLELTVADPITVAAVTIEAVVFVRD